MSKSKYVSINYGLAVGGEASVYSVYDMPIKYSRIMQNCHVSARGGAEKMPGYSRCNDVSCETNLTSGYEFRTTNGVRRILAAGGGKIYKFSEGSLVCIKDGLNQNAVVHFATFGDVCIITNGVDAPLKYDGVQVTSLGGNPPSTAFKAHVHKGRVWMIERSNTMLATCSALNDPEDYTGTTAGYIDFRYVLKEGDELVDMATYVDLLIFFFKKHIAIYSGTVPVGENADFHLVQLIEGCGLVNTGAQKGYASDIVFLHGSGVKSLRQVVTTGSLSVGEVSQVVAPVLREQIAANNKPYSVAHYPLKSWLMFLIKDQIWVYSYLWKAWARIVGAAANGMFDTLNGEVYLCGSGHLYKYGTCYSFDGAPISMRWETAHVPFDRTNGNMGYPKFIEFLIAPAAADTVMNCWLRYDYDTEEPSTYNKFTVPGAGGLGITDFDSLPDVDGVQNWSGGERTFFSPVANIRLPAFGGGKTVQVILTNESTAGPFEINNVLIRAEVGRI